METEDNQHELKVNSNNFKDLGNILIKDYNKRYCGLSPENPNSIFKDLDTSDQLKTMMNSL